MLDRLRSDSSIVGVRSSSVSSCVSSVNCSLFSATLCFCINCFVVGSRSTVCLFGSALLFWFASVYVIVAKTVAIFPFKYEQILSRREKIELTHYT